MSNKEYVSFWVDKDTAERLRELQSCESEKQMVEKAAESLQLGIERELGQLDDDLARYKAACIVFKNSLKKVYQEQQDEIEKVIESQWDIMPTVTKETNSMIRKIEE